MILKDPYISDELKQRSLNMYFFRKEARCRLRESCEVFKKLVDKIKNNLRGNVIIDYAEIRLIINTLKESFQELKNYINEIEVREKLDQYISFLNKMLDVKKYDDIDKNAFATIELLSLLDDNYSNKEVDNFDKIVEIKKILESVLN